MFNSTEEERRPGSIAIWFSEESLEPPTLPLRCYCLSLAAAARGRAPLRPGQARKEDGSLANERGDCFLWSTAEASFRSKQQANQLGEIIAPRKH